MNKIAAKSENQIHVTAWAHGVIYETESGLYNNKVNESTNGTKCDSLSNDVCEITQITLSQILIA